MRSRVSAALLAFTLLAGAAACSTAEEPDIPVDSLTKDVAFVSIARAERSEVAALRHALGSERGAVTGDGSGGNQDFYIAIHKRELGSRWFLSAFLKQYFPGAVSYGAARSLGTRVVSFKLQNGKLFVFDIDNRKPVSDTFDPQVLVEAYPIVTDYAPFNALPNAENYVLFDPASGLNRFGVVADAYADGSLSPTGLPAKFETELAYLQRFRKIGDGVTYEQVFSGVSDTVSDADGAVETNVYRASGTLGIALRKYQEGSGYQSRKWDPRYFVSDIFNVKNAGTIDAYAVHWNIYPGMQPITWLISPQIAELQNDPRFKDYDLVGAVQRGIESWNQAFGFPALEARVASPDDSFADDDKNYLIFDGDPTFGAAFANWRTNPNTGEIRGASVYMNAIWFDDEGFADDPARDGTDALIAGDVPQARPIHPGLTWDSFPDSTLCTRWHPTFAEGGPRDLASASPEVARLTKKEKFERYIQHVVAHEIGHTLGLRHNFKGSLLPASSSVMDYLGQADSIATPVPQAYDIAAIRHLYGLTTELPPQPFCNDSGTRTDPDCVTFDRGAAPRTEFWGPIYASLSGRALAQGFGNASLAYYVDYYMNGLLAFARTTDDPALAKSIFDSALGAGKSPVATTVVSAGQGANADQLAIRVLKRLYLDPVTARGYIRAEVKRPELAAEGRAQLRLILLNSDKIRSFESRRAAVDMLKKMQHAEALTILNEAKATLNAALPSLTGTEEALTRDLLSRIDAATDPYYP